MEIATPSPGKGAGPAVTTGALTAPATEGDEEGAGSPTVGELATGEPPEPDKQVSEDRVPRVGEEDPEELSAESLFDPAATARIAALRVNTPTIPVSGAYALFPLLPRGSSSPAVASVAEHGTTDRC